MRANIPKSKLNTDELETLFSKKLQQASLNGFMLGGHAAMKLAIDRFSEDIRNANSFEQLQRLAFELLAYLEEKSDGLKKIGDNADE